MYVSSSTASTPNTRLRPPRFQASHAATTTATTCSNAWPTNVVHGAPPKSAFSGARAHNSSGPGWFQPKRLYTPTSGRSPFHTSRTRRSITAKSWVGRYARPARVITISRMGTSATTVAPTAIQRRTVCLS